MRMTRCRTCGKEHRGHVCPEFLVPSKSATNSKMEVVRTEAPVRARSAQTEPETPSPKPRVIPKGVVQTDTPEKPAFDRKAYQQAYMAAYMRAYRAKQKGK